MLNMKRVSIIGFHSSLNKGHLLQLESLLHLLRKVLPYPFKIVVFSHTPTLDKKFLNKKLRSFVEFKKQLNYSLFSSIVNLPFLLISFLLNSKKYFLFNEYLNELNDSYLVLGLPGDSISSRYGFKNAIYHFLQILFPILLKKKVILVSISIKNPFYITKILLRVILPLLHLVVTRDRETFLLTKKVKTNATIANDITLTYPIKHTLTRRRNIKIGFCIGLRYLTKKEEKLLLSTLPEFLKISKFSAVFFPSSLWIKKRDNDTTLLLEIKKRINEKNIKYVTRNLDSKIFLSLIKESGILVTNRFHTTIMALKLGNVPVLLGNLSKLGDLIKKYRLNYINVEEDLVEKLPNLIEKVSLNYNEISKKLHEKIKKDARLASEFYLKLLKELTKEF
jgi:polysaccharide pyruvyl transferase WcaK-like protein